MDPEKRFPIRFILSLDWSSFVWRWLINLVVFDLLSLQKSLKEMLVVVLPCFVVRRIKKKKNDTLYCPILSFASGAFTCSELLHTAALANFHQNTYIISLYIFTMTKTKFTKFTLNDTMIWLMLIHFCRICMGNTWWVLGLECATE